MVFRWSAKFEYKAMTQSTYEIFWIYYILAEIGLDRTSLANLWCDNLSNTLYHERTKHNEVDCHFICEKIQTNVIPTVYVKVEEQLGDLFTKALNESPVECFLTSRAWLTSIRECYDT